MNILPKKRWHVRTKENIARVRRDEAKAAEEEKERERRAQLAEQEARTAYLRAKARQSLPELQTDDVSSGVVATVSSPSGSHINFFADIEKGLNVSGTNKEHEAEKKAEQEKYEKSIGLLTYLGQGAKEVTGEVPWYEKVPDRKVSEEKRDTKVDIKVKNFHDPLKEIEKHVGKLLPSSTNIKQKSVSREKFKKRKAKKHKLEKYASRHKKRKREKKNHKSHKNRSKKTKHKKNRKISDTDNLSSEGDGKSAKSSSSEYSDCETQAKRQKLDFLRTERIKREKEERRKAEFLLAKHRGEVVKEVEESDSLKPKQKYHSQFNPELARQNLEPRKKHSMKNFV